ncbi:MAG: hypothetical protein AAF675_18620 [Pseudomonadota bacterium]
MQYYSFFICDEEAGRELGGGYIRARNAREARATVPYRDAQITPVADAPVWPTDATGPIAWAYRSPQLKLH